MEKRPNGYRFYNYINWENKKNSSYDYARHGLLKQIMSSPIVNSNNEILKIILKYVESSLIFLMKYTDILKNFKNPHWRNR